MFDNITFEVKGNKTVIRSFDRVDCVLWNYGVLRYTEICGYEIWIEDYIMFEHDDNDSLPMDVDFPCVEWIPERTSPRTEAFNELYQSRRDAGRSFSDFSNKHMLPRVFEAWLSGFSPGYRSRIRNRRI